MQSSVWRAATDPLRGVADWVPVRPDPNPRRPERLPQRRKPGRHPDHGEHPPPRGEERQRHIDDYA